MRLCHILLMVFSVTTLSGCFTGVESTPKITDKEARRQKVVVTPEQTYLSGIAAQPLGEWQKGKRWVVTNPKVRLVMSADAAEGVELAAGDTLSLIGFSQVPAITGESSTIIEFGSPRGVKYNYRINSPIDSLSQHQVNIPFTIDLDVVAQVDSLMRGKVFYTLTRLWLDSAGQPTTGLKFVPVTITSVEGGNENYPLRVNFVDSQGVKWGAFMSLGSDRASTRNFDTLFSFTDPRLRYPSLTPEHWQMIIHGEVTEDMTREECRLSMGAPTSIDQRPGYGGVTEQWVYDDGRYLIFQDGLLRLFRK